MPLFPVCEFSSPNRVESGKRVIKGLFPIEMRLEYLAREQARSCALPWAQDVSLMFSLGIIAFHCLSQLRCQVLVRHEFEERDICG